MAIRCFCLLLQTGGKIRLYGGGHIRLHIQCIVVGGSDKWAKPSVMERGWVPLPPVRPDVKKKEYEEAIRYRAYDDLVDHIVREESRKQKRQMEKRAAETAHADREAKRRQQAQMARRREADRALGPPPITLEQTQADIIEESKQIDRMAARKAASLKNLKRAQDAKEEKRLRQEKINRTRQTSLKKARMAKKRKRNKEKKRQAKITAERNANLRKARAAKKRKKK